jgi:hypothetical protein
MGRFCLEVAVMPLGSPGMETLDAKLQSFNVIAFGRPASASIAIR